MEEKEKDTKNAEKAIADEAEAKKGKSDDCADIKERFLRLAAEFDNYKKRAAKDMESAKGRGKAELMVKILPVLDEFELAAETLDMENDKERGIALVFSNLYDIMKKEGLREIESIGIFDPYKHEIILAKESEKKEGTIIKAIRKGYMFNEIMLRPAYVIVSKGAGEAQGSEDRGN